MIRFQVDEPGWLQEAGRLLMEQSEVAGEVDVPAVVCEAAQQFIVTAEEDHGQDLHI